MYPLFETIKCNNGKLCNLEFHQARFENAQKEYYGISPQITLYKKIEIPEFAGNGLFRCRVTYSKQIEKIEFIHHQYRDIKSLKLVTDNEIDYRFKYSDRQSLNLLFEKRDCCDDIIIVKNGCITDSFTANLVFFDGEKWITPDTPLLPGTQRAKLLYEKKIFEFRISMDDIKKYEKVGLINAMQDLENMPVIDLQNILY
jgi:4-amino-4-deoxychorismate lyase